ncbi:hypothetical protein DEO72_LG4g495 [Vigna unguiculata]|uniref:Uncharacterized protein n=1 Tax=Vigna unguiculata TaxID=3917 RepID=A0A4D6LL99_VIGUN|nr:hypothetical protein DEO72_LG4g495 [Vigna unguiculata]
MAVALGVRVEAVRTALGSRKSEGHMSLGSRRQGPWWTPVSLMTSLAGCSGVMIYWVWVSMLARERCR